MRKQFGWALVAALIVAPVAAQAQSATPRPSQVVAQPKGTTSDREARTRQSSRYRPSANPPQLSEAKALAKTLGVACQVTDASPIAKRSIKGADGQPVRIVSYEIACKDDFGWIISQQSDGVAETFNCMALETSAKAAGRKVWSPEAVCLLPDNGAIMPGLKKLATQAAPACVVEDGAYLGQGGEPPILRYELRCAGGTGFIVDTPTPGSTAKASAMSCVEAAAAGAPCALKKKG